MTHDSSLEPVLRVVEPAVRLVPERHLRQVLHFLIDWGQALPTNPDLPLWVSRSDLVEADVLPRSVLVGTEPSLLLATDPDDRMISHLPREEQLRAYWEVLFAAAIAREIDRRLESGSLTPLVCRERLNQFGAAARREILLVLEAEHLVSPEAGDAARYRAFAAAYLRTAVFARHRLDELFPSLPHGSAVPRALASDLDADAVLARSRPAGAADPHHEPAPDDRWTEPDSVVASPSPPDEDPRGALGRALEAERKGNNVRAAVLRTQVAAVAPPGEREQALAAARGSLGKLVDSLGDLFKWDGDTRQEWRQALGPLLEPAAAGVWPRAARCLYELQKISADLARDVFAVDLAESIRTFGRRPVKRPLPHARPVLILVGLRKAQAQLLRAGLGHGAQLRLDRLFHHQIRELEHDVRREFTPIITGALTRAGLVPVNTVEEVARDKLVAELLDRVCERGYLRIGNLRDAVARNRLKLSDLSGPGELLRGDPLLKADVYLAESLDGVYRKGEFYLRCLQRASSVFFANPFGRAIFLYLLLPFGGAFMTVVFAQEMAHISQKVYRFAARAVAGKSAPPPEQTAQAKPTPAADDDKITADEVEFDEDTGEAILRQSPPAAVLVKEVFTSVFRHQDRGKQAKEHAGFHVPWPWVIGLAVALFLLIHVPAFRAAVVAGFGYLWRAVRAVVWDFPAAVWHSRAVREFRLSRPVRLFYRHFWSPLLITAIVFVLLFFFGPRGTPLFLLEWGWAVWAGLTIAYNTPWGWVVQDRVAEAVSDWWRVVRVNLIPGLIATIIDWFRALANWVERKLYAVDERLRFRGGDSQGSLAVKAVLGLIWFPIAYITRFAFYLLIEPQVNPVKHFPVVTVSHKMLLPLVPTFGELIAEQMGWGEVKANGWAFGIIACIPGIFGFIAWELLSNWQLYRANRSNRLKPVTLGSHGESMRGLLRPGFHSGTVPKLFRKLRHATGAKAARLLHELDHAAEAVHRAAERELVHLLDRAPEWGGLRVAVKAVRFGCQRVTVEFAAPSLGHDPFALGFENVGGRIEASVEQAGWADKLTEAQRGAFVAALRGVLDMAAAERIDGVERSEGAPGGPGFADLARRMTADEWVNRWSRPTG